MVSASAETWNKYGISGQIWFIRWWCELQKMLRKWRHNEDDATGEAGYGFIFVEKTLGDRLAIGVDYVPSALESETTSSSRLDQTGV